MSALLGGERKPAVLNSPVLSSPVLEHVNEEAAFDDEEDQKQQDSSKEEECASTSTGMTWAKYLASGCDNPRIFAFVPKDTTTSSITTEATPPQSPYSISPSASPAGYVKETMDDRIFKPTKRVSSGHRSSISFG